jgi:hypothetical protein
MYFFVPLFRYDDKRRGGGTKSSRGRQKLKYKVKMEQKVSQKYSLMNIPPPPSQGGCIRSNLYVHVPTYTLSVVAAVAIRQGMGMLINFLAKLW